MLSMTRLNEDGVQINVLHVMWRLAPGTRILLVAVSLFPCLLHKHSEDM